MKLCVTIEAWPIRGQFTISRSSLSEVSLVVVSISHGEHMGRGECRPYSRYAETPQSVIAQIETVRSNIEAGISREELSKLLPAGAARNALDCALWDLECKAQSKRVWQIIGRPAPMPRPTAFTLSVDSPEKMAEAASNASDFSVLKLKVSSEFYWKQISSVSKARPDVQLIIDPNEAFSPDQVHAIADHPNVGQIALLEQPLHDDIVDLHHFTDYKGPPICADESLHGIDDLERLKALGYRAVNVKLDKSGGLTEALQLIDKAQTMGFLIMAGCMVATSLAVAPLAALLDEFDFIDLDGGALLEKDREHGLQYQDGYVFAPVKELWG